MISAIFQNENNKDVEKVDEEQLCDEIEMLTPAKERSKNMSMDEACDDEEIQGYGLKTPVL